ncbi:nitrite reductase large subunit NirB [Microvirga lotononidis]|uniref:NAD(P)H-dependent nitrite reductase, large subunit n=1 Tax=Microvirga lotononidis TaxID=864069 RepID=I4YRW4_9HYPH|nr:nitrite reductase large subunit NirB [Microvirga lotononidis]EIM26706.1 NAD(P)H-dependent nitrite reductase, large subunit [Microvirga lotononidis]WQO31624.1 nitrite reductase large subunit NirB [Microvirga lotononidis]
MPKKLVVIGNGMAAGHALEELFERAPGDYEVTIFGAEPRVNYNRIMLSPVLSGEKAYEDILIHDDAWYETHGITLHRGKQVVEIDRMARRVIAADGTAAEYDQLLVATGSMPFVVPIPGATLPGVVTYRDLDDVHRMLEAAQGGGHAIVIGGGLLGLEAAAGLRAQGMEVTVLHLMPTLMERQLDPSAGYLLQKAFEDRGIAVRCKANTHAILGDTQVTGVRLDDGTELPADIVVMAVGIRPNAVLAKDAGLETNRGVLVGDDMRTSDPDIFSVGECVEHRGLCYGLVAPLYEMAKVVAAQLAGDRTAAYTGSVTATKLKVTGIDLFSAGDFGEAKDRQDIVLRDAARGIYKRLVLKENRIVGAVLYGETGDGSWFFDLLRKETDVTDLRDTLIFGQSYVGGAPLDPMAAVAALPDDAEICGCNGVCKGKIVQTITDKGLSTLAEVRAHTKASASCGTCTGLVEQVMTLTLGDKFAKSAVEPMCGCTDLGHDDVRRLIRAAGLKSIPAVMQELGWKTSCGCAKCRPALNYYLLCDWPEEYEDDGRSRFINERIHANIQKDGTYSVVPRMWGGLTNPRELRAIADVAEKYNIPTVKVTGGQRIDLLGVRKEDLPAVWADLNDAGMVSGHAYAKGLRTVKTCVGTEWCRFGTQDSTGLGVKIEKFMWGSWTPAKVKMGVSGCPRNCAESTCKDVGVICVDSGFEIHFAGAAGLHIKGTQILCKVPDEDECIEVIAALTQLYREQGHYLERMYKWADRVGVDSIKATVVEDLEKRRALYERFVISQRNAQVDPWAERVAGRDAHEFRPMANFTLAEAAE